MAEQEEEKPKKRVRSLEERREATQQKLEDMDRKIESRKVRKFWRSEFRKLKSSLNKDKELDFVGRIQAFVNTVYDETGVSAETINDEEDEFDEDEENNEDE